MSTAQEKLSAIDAEINELSTKVQELNERAYELTVSRNPVIREIIKEERLLAFTKWSLVYGSRAVYLTHVGKLNELDKLRKLCFKSWHSDFNFDDNVQFNQNDESIDILFKHNKVSMVDFIKEHGLLVDTSSAAQNLGHKAATDVLVESIVTELGKL